MNDDLGDRMKAYEAVETARVFDSSLPIVVRLDGRAFSTFTRGMKKPFDQYMSDVMHAVTKFLIEKTHAKVGYTQSDEISLVYFTETKESEMIFGARCFKIASVLAGMASAKFALLASDMWPDRVDHMVPSFDCRAFNVPSLVEAVNCLVWREMDGSRNAIQMVAQSLYSQKQLHGKSCDTLEEMIADKGIHMTDYPDHCRWGAYMSRQLQWIALTDQELDEIPSPHRPVGLVQRNQVEFLTIAPLRSKPNKVELVFGKTEVSVDNLIES